VKYSCIVFDLDGTIYFGNKLANKANQVIQKARTLSKKTFFITNNSAKTRKQVLQKLENMGIDIKLEELVTSSYAVALYLKANNYYNVYCIGTKSFKDEIEQFNINTSADNPQAVVVGYNPNFKLDDLNELANINLSNYKLIAANKERIYPKENGYLVPGAGAIISAVENLLNRKTDVIVGKPNVGILKAALSGFDFKPKEICVVGDSYDSDIKMAENFGANGILISDEYKPDCLCISKLADLLEIWND